jgi:tRNA nucleotidyltransferase/poly(A) polymerase
MRIEYDVEVMLDFLHNNNVKVYLVGGFVRDTILNRYSKDYDIAVDKPVIEIIPLLRNAGYTVIDTSKEFGSIAVIINKKKIDIAEFRNDKYDMISRKPVISKVNSIEEDLKRRDFTINSMAIEYPTNYIIDPYNGTEDLLKKKTLVTVRNANIVFKEDALRIMRAIRFASKYDLSITEIEKALKKNLIRLNSISKERIREELIKGFSDESYVNYAKMLISTGILKTIIPETKKYTMLVHDFRGHHYGESLGQHAIDTLSRYNNIDALDRIIAFLHDIGKINTRKINGEKIQYIGHDLEGAKLIEIILKRLKFTRKEVSFASKVITNHLFFSQLSKTLQPNKQLAKFFIEQNENMNFIVRLIKIAEADQNKNYIDYMQILFRFGMIPKLILGKDVLFMPEEKRGIAIAKARYYQLIGEATTKEKLLHLIATDYKEGVL